MRTHSPTPHTSSPQPPSSRAPHLRGDTSPGTTDASDSLSSQSHESLLLPSETTDGGCRWADKCHLSSERGLYPSGHVIPQGYPGLCLQVTAKHRALSSHFLFVCTSFSRPNPFHIFRRHRCNPRALPSPCLTPQACPRTHPCTRLMASREYLTKLNTI